LCTNFADQFSSAGAHTAARARRGAEAARGAREAARDAQNAVDCANPDAPGLFAFINASLGDGSAAAAVHRRALGASGNGGGGAAAAGRYFGATSGGAAKAAPPSRQALAAQQARTRDCGPVFGVVCQVSSRHAMLWYVKQGPTVLRQWLMPTFASCGQ